MSNPLPDYYFRIKDNGAVVFRVDTENRHRRIELEKIAVINLKKDEVRVHGKHELTDADNAAIAKWIEARKAQLAGKRKDKVQQAIESLNMATHWINSQASPEEIENACDALLLAMHDMRTVLVQKRARQPEDS